MWCLLNSHFNIILSDSPIEYIFLKKFFLQHLQLFYRLNKRSFTALTFTVNKNLKYILVLWFFFICKYGLLRHALYSKYRVWHLQFYTEQRKIIWIHYALLPITVGRAIFITIIFHACICINVSVISFSNEIYTYI